MTTGNISTIGDFDKQWKTFQKQVGVYADEQYFFSTYFDNLFNREDLKGKVVAEVGCGNGRFIKIMSVYAKEVVGFEPSGAVEVAKKYCEDRANIKLEKESVYDIQRMDEFDIVFCLGVLHHLPDPVVALKKIFTMLKPDGLCYIWVYGKENNGLYLKIFKPLINITSRFPHWLLNVVAFCLAIVLKIYIILVRSFKFFPWPMKDYTLNVLNNLDFYYLKLTIYDQLNPKIANYYSKEEICSLVASAGFKSISTHHRYKYSWSIKALKV